MKFVSILLAATAAASGALAHGLEDYVPECSIECLDKAVASATTCEKDDLPCFCVLENWHAIDNASTQCVITACGQDVAAGKFKPLMQYSSPTLEQRTRPVPLLQDRFLA